MFVFFENIHNNTELYLYVLLSAIAIAKVIDFSLGWLNARFNKNVVFESGQALYGIIKKMMYFIVLVFFMFISLIILPSVIAVPALITLYVGYLFSEINSILSHLGYSDDGKKGELFNTFIKRLLKGDG